ncbi:hypothetical protein PG593_08620 [Riemerella anatipestifer]|nr:hypothetical protein [Riemerella anatipestifer]
MHCQTVIKRRDAFRGLVGATTETRRSDDGAVRNKKRLPKWQKGKFTKHYFEGTSRIVSKLGEGTFHQPTGLTAGSIDYIKQSAKIQEAIDNYVRGLNVPPGPPTQHGIYGTSDFTGQEYPSIDWSDISQDQEPPEGWPRPPKFNEPGDVPGPPVQYGDPVKPDNVKGGFGYVDNGIEEKNLYFYHPDHLGSSSYITDANGDINQHTEYMAFGEVLFDEHKVSRRMPYLFNGKELDSETGLYYYGARYYDPRVSLWLNVDPLVEKTLEPYSYTNNNPIMLIDPDGLFPRPPNLSNITNVTNVLSGKKWISYGSDITITSVSSLFGYELSRRTETRSSSLGNYECADYSRLQVKQGGNNYTAVGSKKRVDMYVKAGGDESKLDLQKGINIIVNNLKEGKAVMAGVMYDAQKETGNSNSATNHYVTIVGMGKDNDGYYFSYYDNFTGGVGKDVGTDVTLNKFRLYKSSKGTYYFSDGKDGSIPYNGNKPAKEGRPTRYVLTEVRDNE